jgi:hypothetical protein
MRISSVTRSGVAVVVVTRGSFGVAVPEVLPVPGAAVPMPEAGPEPVVVVVEGPSTTVVAGDAAERADSMPPESGAPSSSASAAPAACAGTDADAGGASVDAGGASVDAGAASADAGGATSDMADMAESATGATDDDG